MRLDRRQVITGLAAVIGAVFLSAHHRPGHRIPPGRQKPTTTTVASTTTTTLSPPVSAGYSDIYEVIYA